MNNELVGTWNSDLDDQQTKNSIGKVVMTFTADGQLIYDSYEGDKIQRINLIFTTDGNIIISDQPSHPQEQQTEFKIENNDKLIMGFEGEKTVFTRK